MGKPDKSPEDILCKGMIFPSDFHPKMAGK